MNFKREKEAMKIFLDAFSLIKNRKFFLAKYWKKKASDMVRSKREAFSHHCDGIIIKISVGHSAVVRLYISAFFIVRPARIQKFLLELR